MRLSFFLFLLLLACVYGNAQQTKKDTSTLARPDTTEIMRNDSLNLKKEKIIDIESYAARYDPRKALFYSAILPGAGQAYNKKYWKIPLVYGGFISLIAVVKFYNDSETRYRNLLFTAINQPSTSISPVNGLTNTQLITQLRPIVEQARRQRDYFTIFTGLFYILQLVDAHVDAHLKEFDLNPQLHVKAMPWVSPGGIGMGLSVRF